MQRPRCLGSLAEWASADLGPHWSGTPAFGRAAAPSSCWHSYTRRFECEGAGDAIGCEHQTSSDDRGAVYPYAVRAPAAERLSSKAELLRCAINAIGDRRRGSP